MLFVQGSSATPVPPGFPVSRRTSSLRHPEESQVTGTGRQAPSPTNEAGSPSSVTITTGLPSRTSVSNGTSSLRADVSALLERIQCVLSRDDDFAQLHPKTTRIRADCSEILASAASSVVVPCFVGPADARFWAHVGVLAACLRARRPRRVSQLHPSGRCGFELSRDLTRCRPFATSSVPSVARGENWIGSSPRNMSYTPPSRS